MCFSAKSDYVKIATKPIKVYKTLSIRNTGPVYCDFKYRRGLNRARGNPSNLDPLSDEFVYGSGWLHAEKINFGYGISTPMFIPKGAKYKDDGINLSRNEIISSELYWPKDWFDYLIWNLKSKLCVLAHYRPA